MRLQQLAGTPPPSHGDGVTTFPAEVIDAVQTQIDQSLAFPPTAATLATRYGMSLGHFSRKWRWSMGCGIQAFTNLRRVAAALELLNGSDASLAILAQQLGFCSQSHFTRVFSDVMGIAPRRYRQVFGAEPEAPPDGVASGAESGRG